MRGEGPTTIYRTERRAGFAQIPNDALRDERLSFRARGLLAYMLSFPDDWRHRADDLSEKGKEGREAVRTALRELEAIGYRVKEKRQDELGQWRTHVILRDFLPDDREPVGREDGTSADRASYEDCHEDCHEDRDADQPSLLGDDAVPPTPAKKPRARNPIFDALADVYPAATPSEKGLIGSVSSELAKLEPKPDYDEVHRRATWARREWPTSSPRAVAKHWTMIGERLGARPSTTGDEFLDMDAGIRAAREGGDT